MTDEPMKVMMPSEPPPSQPANPGPGPVRRFFGALARLLLLMLLVGGVAAAGYYLWQELQRSSGSANARLNDQAAQIDALSVQLETQEGEVAAARATLTGLDAQLAGNLDELQTAAQSIDEAQNESLGTLASEVATLSAAAGTVDASLAALGDRQETLQIEARGLDEALSGQNATAVAMLNNLSGLATRQGAVVQTVTDFEAELVRADPAALRQAMQVFRLWQLVARARLRLVENNLGLAADDVNLSLGALAALSENSAGRQAEALGRIEERLLAVQENLPDAPLPAANDLDLVWQDLDGLLNSLLEEQIAAQGTPTPEGTDAPITQTPIAVTATPTQEPAATP